MKKKASIVELVRNKGDHASVLAKYFEYVKGLSF
jgi:hypothetical protein